MTNRLINIQPPRELCKHCTEWSTQDDVGPNDLPGCVHDAFGTLAHSYIIGDRNDCPYFFEDI